MYSTAQLFKSSKNERRLHRQGEHQGSSALRVCCCLTCLAKDVLRAARPQNPCRLGNVIDDRPSTNLNRVQADSFFVWDAAGKTYVNLQSSIVGLAPSTLNTLQALAAAVWNSPQFSTKLAATTAALQTSIATKAPLPSPTFAGTVAGVTNAVVGLGSVDRVVDLNKPVSTATQTALDLRGPLASPTFAGTVAGVTKAMVG